jgi:hypothetical protein
MFSTLLDITVFHASLLALIVGVVGFVAGALVFHNNEAKGNAVVSSAQADASKVQAAANTVAQTAQTVASDIKKA